MFSLVLVRISMRITFLAGILAKELSGASLIYPSQGPDALPSRVRVQLCRFI